MVFLGSMWREHRRAMKLQSSPSSPTKQCGKLHSEKDKEQGAQITSYLLEIANLYTRHSNDADDYEESRIPCAKTYYSKELGIST